MKNTHTEYEEQRPEKWRRGGCRRMRSPCDGNLVAWRMRRKMVLRSTMRQLGFYLPLLLPTDVYVGPFPLCGDSLKDFLPAARTKIKIILLLAAIVGAAAETQAALLDLDTLLSDRKGIDRKSKVGKPPSIASPLSPPLQLTRCRSVCSFGPGTSRDTPRANTCRCRTRGRWCRLGRHTATGRT